MKKMLFALSSMAIVMIVMFSSFTTVSSNSTLEKGVPCANCSEGYTSIGSFCYRITARQSGDNCIFFQVDVETDGQSLGTFSGELCKDDEESNISACDNDPCEWKTSAFETWLKEELY